MVVLQQAPLEVQPLLDAVHASRHGALLVFHGTTRDHHGERKVVELSYQAYAELAVPELEAIITEAESRWRGTRVAIAHRLGRVPPGESSVLVVTAAAHRAECYEANRFAIDQLKLRAAIWKKEHYEDGTAWKANTSTPS